MAIVDTAQADADRPDVDGETEGGLKPAHFLVLLLVLLFFIADGIDMQIFGVTVSAIAGDWDLPLSAFSTAMAAGHAGAALGALLGGALGDRVGRRPVMIGGALLFGSLTLLVLFATAPSHIVVLRFVAGIGLGGCLPPGLALLSECMPPRFRSLALSLAILCAPIGIAIAGLLASAVLPQQGWQTVFIIAGCLPVILAFLLWIALPESPAFLFKAGGRDEQAKRLQERFGLSEAPPSAASSGQPGKAAFKAILGKGRLVKSLSLFGVFFVCYLAMSMVLSWLPALLSRVGFGDSVAGFALATWSLSGMGGVVLAGFLMSRYGTRRIVGIFLAATIFALGLVAFALPQAGDSSGLQLFYVLIGTGGFMLNGTMTSIIAHAARVFEPEVRSTGIGLSTMWGRLGAISGAFVGAFMFELTGANGFFGIISAALLFAFVLYTIETFVSRNSISRR